MKRTFPKAVLAVIALAVLSFTLLGCVRDGQPDCEIVEPPEQPEPPGAFLDVSKVNIGVYDGAVSRITFSTNQSPILIEELGLVGNSGDSPFLVDNFFDSLSGEESIHLIYDSVTMNGYVDISSLSNTIGTYSHRIFLRAGDLIEELFITTYITDLPTWAAYPFVGTFHRWNERGERVISSASTGAWSAEIVTDAVAPTDAVAFAEEDNFVILSRLVSPAIEEGIWRTADPGNPEDYPVPGDETAVSGNGRIFFRVGMKEDAPSANMPRYARIKLNWMNGDVETVSYIYVRQGEAVDYVMRPEDGLTNSPNIPPRINAVKFTVYNITDPRLGGGPDITDHSPIGGKGGVFTDYPSQAGYLFLWNLSDSANYSRAFNPSVPAPTVSINGFTKEILSYSWNPAKDVCPTGYRHASDGVWNAGDVTRFSSEYRQSLFLNPSSSFAVDDLSNSQFGYYADGWTDRQELGVSPGASVPLGTIGRSGHVAYIGRLYYNPYTQASLFFPAGGGRAASTGKLSGDGVNGLYWTSSTGGGGAAAFMSVYGRMNNQRTGSACYARCVPE